MRLVLDDLHLHIGDSHVLQGVSLALAEGRTVVVLGRNGAGKTTLVRTIAGLAGSTRPGSLRLDDADIADAGRWPAWRRARAGIGYVPQGRRVFTSLTVEENLRVALRAAEGARWTLDSLYRLFPILRERRSQLAPVLSGGEQQMLAIARALAGNPRVILLDEPTEGLAPLMVELVRETLAAIRDAGHAVLLVEQNFRIAGPLADEIHVLNAGRVAESTGPLRARALQSLAERHLGL